MLRSSECSTARPAPSHRSPLFCWQALRAAEQRRRELEEENETLRVGVEARDQALRAMEEEVERSAEVLDAGQQTREVTAPEVIALVFAEMHLG